MTGVPAYSTQWRYIVRVTTLIQVMLFIPWYHISLYWGGHWVTRTLFLYTGFIWQITIHNNRDNTSKQKASCIWCSWCWCSCWWFTFFFKVSIWFYWLTKTVKCEWRKNNALLKKLYIPNSWKTYNTNILDQNSVFWTIKNVPVSYIPKS